MMIMGMMLLALICLVVGLVLPSSAWLIASLIATAGSGYLLWKMHSTLAPSPAVAGSTPTAESAIELVDATDADDAEPSADDDRPTQTIPVVRSEPDLGPLSALTPGVPAAAAGDVWVIDGRPRYHLGNCPIIQGQGAEPIPIDQATEDGFMPCSLCEPHLARSDY